MKIGSIYIYVFALLMFSNACKVERLPETDINDNAFWKTEADFKTGSNALYNYLPGPADLISGRYESDLWSDDTYGTTFNDISDGSRIAAAADQAYTRPYQLIRTANNIIEKVEVALNLGAIKADLLDRYKAEALFFRAYGHFLLVQKYGDVPLILKTLNEVSPELQMARTPREEVYDQIYSDLDFAFSKLPTPSVLGSADFGRVSKTAAYALKARAALFEGTRSKFHNYGDPQKHLNIAISAANAVMISGQHSLFSNYFNLFQYAGEGSLNKENILVRQYGLSASDRVLVHNYARQLENGNNSPTKNLVDSYLMKDGLPTDKSPLYKSPSKTASPTTVTTNAQFIADRDPRLSATIAKSGDEWTGSAAFTFANLTLQKTGFMGRKYFNKTEWGYNTQSIIDRIVIRYAEVLLIYAEAKYELNESISDADLDLSINLLRTRAGMPKLTNTFVTNNGLNMRDEIRRERRVELALEGFRYFDLIRWKTAEVELVKSILGNFLFNEFGTTANNVPKTADNYIILQNSSSRKFNPERDYLWPIPNLEIAQNPHLIQNHKW